MSDVILLIVNVILTIASAVGAWKSNEYYTKSKYIINYAQINKALIEINNMLTKLPEALAAANKSAQGKRGMSLQNKLCGIGRELYKNLIEIRKQIPSEYAAEFNELEKSGSFELQKYINSFIIGEAVKGNCIDSNDYNSCQERLNVMQEYLKKKSAETEEKLK